MSTFDVEASNRPYVEYEEFIILVWSEGKPLLRSDGIKGEEELRFWNWRALLAHHYLIETWKNTTNDTRIAASSETELWNQAELPPSSHRKFVAFW